jgi:hypothetical protein
MRHSAQFGSIIMLNVVMLNVSNDTLLLNVIMLNVILLNVIMLKVVAPFYDAGSTAKTLKLFQRNLRYYSHSLS